MIKNFDLLNIYGGALGNASVYLIRGYTRIIRKLNDIFIFWRK